MTVIAILLLTAVMSAGTETARAVCVGGIPFEKLAEAYPVIFEGEVTGETSEVLLKTERLPGGRTLHWLGLRVEMKVHKVWAGPVGESIAFVYTHHAQNIHGRFDLGERFIVWAERRDGRWQTNDCAPTIERDRATADMLAFLDRLKK